VTGSDDVIHEQSQSEWLSWQQHTSAATAAPHRLSAVSRADVTAQGTGLTEATVNQQTSFTVDTSRGGRLSFTVLYKLYTV